MRRNRQELLNPYFPRARWLTPVPESSHLSVSLARKEVLEGQPPRFLQDDSESCRTDETDTHEQRDVLWAPRCREGSNRKRPFGARNPSEQEDVHRDSGEHLRFEPTLEVRPSTLVPRRRGGSHDEPDDRTHRYGSNCYLGSQEGE